METYPMKKILPYVLMFLAISQTSFGLNVFSQLISAQFENKATDYSTGTKGRVWYNTASERIRFDTGSAYRSLVTENDTQTLTNKTIDADSNTITNIENADIKSGAAISRSKIASGTANYVVINDSGGALASEATLATSRGGTNIASYTTGDLVYASSSSVISKLGIGSSGQVLKVSGGLPAWSASGATLAVNSESANYVVLNTDDLVVGDTSSGNITFTLPACSSNSGKVFHFKKIADNGGNLITIARAGSDTIDGATSATLKFASEALTMVCDGVNAWYIL